MTSDCVMTLKQTIMVENVRSLIINELLKIIKRPYKNRLTVGGKQYAYESNCITIANRKNNSSNTSIGISSHTTKNRQLLYVIF